MLKVLHFVSSSSEGNYQNAIAEHYDRRKYQVLLCTLHGKGAGHDAMTKRNIPSFYLNCNQKIFYPIAILKLYFLLKKLNIDILQTHMFYASLIGMIAGRLARTPLLILTRHHSDSVHKTGKRLLIALDKLSNILADKIIAPSQMVIDILVNKEVVPPEKVELIYYGFDFPYLKTSSENAAERIRQEFSCQDSFLIGTIGRLHPEKGHVYLFEAIKDLLKVYDNIKVLLVGDGDFKSHLEKTLLDMGIREHFIFTGFRCDVPDLLAAVDIVVHPSLHEAFCQVMIEALAMGKALIITDVSGAPDVIKHNVNGILIPQRNSRAIYEAILSLVNNPEHAKQLGQNAQIDVRNRFDIKTMMGSYESCYEKWAAEKGLTFYLRDRDGKKPIA